MRTATRYTAMVLILITAGVGLFLDAATGVDAPQTPEPSPVALPSPTRGSAYCVPLTDEDEGARLTLLAVGDDAHAEVVAGGDVIEEAEVGPGSPTVIDVPEESARLPITVRWSDAPVVATYETTGDGAQVHQSCVPTTEPRWHLSGFDTTLGNHATVHLYNPFSVDAVARIRYATPDGAVDLVTTQDLAVPAGEAVAVDIDEVQPEVADLGVIVDVLTGRLVAAGEMRFGPPDEDTPAPTDRAVLAGVADPSTEQFFAYGAVSDGAEQAWVSIMNPDPEREALILITVSAPDPEAPVQAEISVPPGGTVRADLAGLSERRTFATAVSSVNGVGVVATRYSVRDVDDEAAVDAAPGVAPSEEWLLPSAGTEGRSTVVDVFNPGGEAATVTLQPLAADAEDAAGDGGGDLAPPHWQGARMEPNTQHGFSLAELGLEVSSLGVRVHADVPVVAGIRSAQSSGAAAGFWTLAGFSPSAWSGLGTRPGLEFAPQLDREPLPSATQTP